MKLTNERIHKFQNIILNWWQTNRRDLPWRHTHDPYKILVSEIMLQQTQVSRVLARYTEFIEVYPTARSLARATAADVLRLWKGMGYNRRALYLKKAAEIGKFPKSEKELSKLPGVGTYTARAILVFAYKKNIACVDTNIRRIITHFFFGDKPQKESVIQSVADQLVPKGKSWEWHQALMDFGALALQSRAKPALSLSKGPRDPSKKTIPFRQSNRFYRGRLVDLLRDGAVKEQILLKDFAPSIIEALLLDGLIVRTNGLLALPE